MVTELADDHLGGQEHRELGEIGDRQWNGDDGESPKFVFESGGFGKHGSLLVTGANVSDSCSQR